MAKIVKQLLYDKNERVEFYPENLMGNIIDEETGENLYAYLSKFNHINAGYSDDFTSARESVPAIMRRNGLYITYHVNNEPVTKFFVGTDEQAGTDDWLNDDYWEIADGAGIVAPDSIGLEQLKTDVIDLIVNNGGTIINSPDNEDLYSKKITGGASDGSAVSVLKFKDKEYNETIWSGLGRVYLRKNVVQTADENNSYSNNNVLTQCMLESANTRYIVQYDYDLNGETIVIPENTVLDFQGGSFKNGTISLTDTKIINEYDTVIFDNVAIDGTYNDVIYVDWFKDADTDAAVVNNLLAKFTDVRFGAKTYNYADSLYGGGNGRIVGSDNTIILSSGEYGIYGAAFVSNMLVQCSDGIGIYNVDTVDKIAVRNSKVGLQAVNSVFDSIIHGCETGIVDSEASNKVVSYVTVYDCSVGMEYRDVIDVNIADCIVRSCTKYAIYVDCNGVGKNAAITIKNCDVSYENSAGIYIVNAEGAANGIIVENCVGDVKYEGLSLLNDDSIRVDDAVTYRDRSNFVDESIADKFDTDDMYTTQDDTTYIKCPQSFGVYTPYAVVLNKGYYRIGCDIVGKSSDEAIGVTLTLTLDIAGVQSTYTIGDTNHYGNMFYVPGLTNVQIVNISASASCSAKFFVDKVTPAGETSERVAYWYTGLCFFDTTVEKPLWWNGSEYVEADSEYADVNRVGESDERPTPRRGGFMYFDTDLNKPIWWNGSEWVGADSEDADVLRSGTTAQRPTGVKVGYAYYDTDADNVVFWNGEEWVSYLMAYSGDTDSRPNSPLIGTMYWDETIEAFVLWNGTEWIEVPRVCENPHSGTTDERPTDVKEGFVYWDTTIEGFVIWNGSEWVELGQDGQAVTRGENLTSQGELAFVSDNEAPDVGDAVTKIHTYANNYVNSEELTFTHDVAINLNAPKVLINGSTLSDSGGGDSIARYGTLAWAYINRMVANLPSTLTDSDNDGTVLTQWVNAIINALTNSANSVASYSNEPESE